MDQSRRSKQSLLVRTPSSKYKCDAVGPNGNFRHRSISPSMTSTQKQATLSARTNLWGPTVKKLGSLTDAEQAERMVRSHGHLRHKLAREVELHGAPAGAFIAFLHLPWHKRSPQVASMGLAVRRITPGEELAITCHNFDRLVSPKPWTHVSSTQYPSSYAPVSATEYLEPAPILAMRTFANSVTKLGMSM